MTPQEQITALTRLVSALTNRVDRLEAVNDKRKAQDRKDAIADRNAFRNPEVEARARSIIEAVAVGHGISVLALTGRSQSKPLAYYRGKAIHQAKKAGMSTPEIGRIMGGRHHTTIMHLERVYLEGAKSSK
ncbi:MAG: helix-turn-helix domain-containing protein [Cypionkella sp.]|nr:helix-turn-helix domain-containing protein [Cypionkella sp.]